VREHLWQRWNVVRPSPGLVDQGGDKTIPERSGRDTMCHSWMLEFDGARTAESEGLISQLPRHWLLWQKHPRRMALFDYLPEVERRCSSCRTFT
jgi:hypothetical protein